MLMLIYFSTATQFVTAKSTINSSLKSFRINIFAALKNISLNLTTKQTVLNFFSASRSRSSSKFLISCFFVPELTLKSENCNPQKNVKCFQELPLQTIYERVSFAEEREIKVAVYIFFLSRCIHESMRRRQNRGTKFSSVMKITPISTARQLTNYRREIMLK